MHLPFIVMPSAMASSCFIGQYFSTLGSTASLESGHPRIIYFHSMCNLGSSYVVAHVFYRCIHRDGYDLLMLCILPFMPGISWSWFSVWLWYDSQSVMYSLGLGLYRVSMLYWCIHGMMHCSFSANITTSLHIMVTSS